jgi:KDO2-lipid IV(A) lauroyltransferase
MVVSTGPSTQRIRLRHRIEHAGLRIAVAVARRLPVEAVAGIGALVMGVIGPRLRQNRRALANLAVAFPDRSADERAAIARRMWANMGRTYAETLIIDRVAADASRLALVDAPLWRAKTSEPGPVVCCSLHMGNWEVAAQPLGIFGRQAAGVYKPLDNPLIDAWLRTTRNGLYPGGLLGKGLRDDADGTGQRTARQLIERARNAGALCFIADHFDRRGEPIPFMGRTARFTTAPAMIARHVGARVWLARCRRIGTSSRFAIDVVEIQTPNTGDRKADAIALTARIFAQFEAWIRDEPEQWMWWNTRWVATSAEAQDAEAACPGRA